MQKYPTYSLHNDIFLKSIYYLVFFLIWMDALEEKEMKNKLFIYVVSGLCIILPIYWVLRNMRLFILVFFLPLIVSHFMNVCFLMSMVMLQDIMKAELWTNNNGGVRGRKKDKRKQKALSEKMKKKKKKKKNRSIWPREKV